VVALHRHLARELDALGLGEGAPPAAPAWAELLSRISRTYDEADRERQAVERSSSSVEVPEPYARLAAERDHFRAIFESAPVGIWRIALDGVVVEVNPALERMLGYTRAEMTGRPLWEFVDERDAGVWQSYYGVPPERRPDILGADRHYLRKGGAIVYSIVSVSMVEDPVGRPSFSIHVVEDVTEHRRLEIELRQAHKLESVGRLAAGLAHEINTPIQFISDSVLYIRDAVASLAGLIPQYRGLLQTVVDADGSGRLAGEIDRVEEDADLGYVLEHAPKAVDRSIEGLKRVATIVRSMREFAQLEGHEMTWVDLNRAIESTLAVARSEYTHVAEIETDLQEIPLVACHGGEVNQVILNMIVNAAQAIEDVVAGTEQRGVIMVRTAREDDAVVVSIADTGAGIPEAVRHRIFEPFFTTKEVGRGTGQGLAIARSVVVDKHGGQVSFQSDGGKGTTFFVRLPINGKKTAAPMAGRAA
jgi:two-component system NtrC family sensor kinase